MTGTPKFAREALVAGVWVASAISVSGYTWNAFKSTISNPAAGSAVAPGPAAVPLNSQATGKIAANKVTSSIPIIGKPLTAAGNWLSNLVSGSGFGQGPSSLSGKQLSRLQSLPGPPAQYSGALKRAQDGNGDKAKAANAFLGWAIKNGWNHDDVNNYLKYIGINLQ